MSTLPDFAIRQAIESNVVDIIPFKESQLQAASYDLCLGRTLLVEDTNGIKRWWYNSIRRAPKRKFKEIKLGCFRFSSYVLMPGEFVLAHTKEYIRVPDFIEATVQLKSSIARLGIDHNLAGYIDPGFPSKTESKPITLEITNNSAYPVELTAGAPICQIRFASLDRRASVLTPYYVNGHYTADTGQTVEPAWFSGDFKRDR